MTALAVAVLLAGSAGTASAAPGKTGGILLQEPFGARPYALGQAYAAFGDDVYALPYNPAALTRLTDTQLAAQFMQSLGETRLGYVAVASPLSPNQSLGVSAAYLDAGKIEIFDAAGLPSQTRNLQRDFLVQAAYARSYGLYSGRLHLGAGGKLMRSVVADEATTTGYAADVGSLFERSWRRGWVSAAAGVFNIGPSLRYSGGITSGAEADPMPLTARFGLGLTQAILKTDAIGVGLQVDRVQYDDSLFESLGVEYDFRHLFALRAGYRQGQDSGRITLGAGMEVKGFAFDYAFGLSEGFNNVQQFSLTYHFTVPGIRYGKPLGAAATPVETLIARADELIGDTRLFDAVDELARIQAFFPGTHEAERIGERIRVQREAALVAGPSSPLYSYSMALDQYQRAEWGPAIARLETALRAQPDNRELKTHLEKAKLKFKERADQARLEEQARKGTLLDLATQAFEDGDLARAERIVSEILRIGVYRPAESLRERILEQRRQALAAPVRPTPRLNAPISPTPTVKTTAENASRAETLYYEALRRYGENNLDQALQKLAEGLKLNPYSQPIRSTFDSIERELKKQRESEHSP
jgi:tetratricopeptide (TPR) repeat protein